MAPCTVLPVKSSSRFGAAASCAPRDQTQNPRHLIRIDVEGPGLRVPGSAAPLTPAIESREHDGALETRRRKLRPGAELRKSFQHLLMRLGRTLRQHIHRELLPGKGSRL